MSLKQLNHKLSPLLLNIIPDIVEDHLLEMNSCENFRLFHRKHKNYQFELINIFNIQCKALFLSEAEYQKCILDTEKRDFELGKVFSKNPYLTLEIIFKLTNSLRICTVRHFLKVIYENEHHQQTAKLIERLFELSNHRQNALFKGFIDEQNKRLYSLIFTDPLTGAYNRRYFYEKIQKELEKAKRRGYSLTIMHIDLNNLKKINDEFGHLEGDNLLRYFTKIVSKIRLDFDNIFRFGGDEFVLLLPNCSESDAENIGKRLNKDINSYNPKASLSYGTVEIPIVPHPEKINIDHYIKIADERMYRSKYLYKNQN